jgi:cytochrome d ubiquinol oxidase subunit II
VRSEDLLGAGICVFPLAVATGATSAVEATGAFAALFNRRFRLARLAAAAQVPLIVLGWAASQYPWLLVPDSTIAYTAAPRVTLVLLLWEITGGAGFLIPALWMLFRVFKGRHPSSTPDPT